MRRPTAARVEKVELQMTPMIDVVFQLMAFFLMTFKVAAVEGDFNLRLPADDRPPMGSGPQSIEVRLLAAPDGALRALQIDGGTPIDDRSQPWERLRNRVARQIDDLRAAGLEEPEIVINADDGLHYEHAVDAVSAVSFRYVDGLRQPLAAKVSFKPKPSH